MTRFDRFIFTAAFLILAAFSYFLYDDSLLFPKREDQGLEKIGQVSFSNNDVRLKTATAFTWLPAQKSDQVHHLDSVFTGERSEASIQLADGTVLNLKPNSLVTLNMKNGQMNLDLRYGDIASKLSGKGTLKITAGDKSFELDGDGAVRINKSSGGDVDLALVEGNARLNKQQPLDKEKALNLGKGGQIKEIGESRIDLKTPDQAVFTRLAGDEPFALEWSGKGALVEYTVELCETQDCKTPRAKTTKASQLVVKDAIKDGAWFWRVKGFDKFGKVGATSRVQSLTLTVAQPPKITTPGGDEARVESVTRTMNAEEVMTAEAKLSWTTDPNFVKYPYQMSTDPEFAAVLTEAEATGGEVLTPKLGSGIYYYRVRGALSDGRASAWSDVAKITFDLRKDVIQKPKAPILANRKIDFNPAAEKARTPASIPRPVFRWSRVDKAASYQVQIARAVDFKDPLSFNVRTTSMAWSDYKPGPWHVRVFAVNQDGLKSPPSEPGLLTVILNDPILKPVAGQTRRGETDGAKAPLVHFKTEWSEIPLAAGYQLQVSNEPTFAAAQLLKTATPVLSVPASSPGKYFFRVQAVDESGAPLTQYSNVIETSYVFKNPVAPPVLAEPFDKASIFLQQIDEPFIWLEWRKVADVSQYELEVSTDPQFRTKFIATRLAENRFLLKQQIPVGKIYWRVRSLVKDEAKISDWTKPREFSILSKKNEGFVQ